MINRLTLIIGIIACFLSTFVLGTYMGFLVGSSFCEVKYPIIAGGWVSDLNPYYTYFDRQRLITLSIFVFLIGKNFKNKFLSSVICISSLFLPIYSNSETIYYKIKLWDEADKYLKLQREMFNYELGIGLMVLTLLILEIILIRQNFLGKKDDGLQAETK